MLDQEILDQQSQIETARSNVKQARELVRGLEQQLKAHSEITEPENEEEHENQLAELLGQWDDGMDELENCESTLETALETYANLEAVAALPAKQEELATLNETYKSIKQDLKIAKQQQKALEAQRDRAIVELNEEGYNQFVQDVQARIEAANMRIEAINSWEEPEPEGEDYQPPTGPDSTVEEEEALIETFNTVLENLATTNAELNAKLNAANEQLDIQTGVVTDLEAELAVQSGLIDGVREVIDPLSEPQYSISLLKDDTPFLLLPLRLETRFITVKHGMQTSPPVGMTMPDAKELWIRIFPDDLAIHVHEPLLTSEEESRGHAYWREFWGQEDEKIGAWRVLSGAYGPERAAWIARQTKPTNINTTPLPVSPAFPTLTLQSDSWTERAESRVMPERFYVRVYTDHKDYEDLGNIIPDPLPLGMGPEDDSFDQFAEEVNFPDDIAWLSNFDKAVEQGMGFKIRFEDPSCTKVNKLLVVGIRLGSNKADATKRVEEMIDNHHFTDGGFAIVPQGTPTNNTEEVKSPYEGYETDATVSMEVEQSDPLFTASNDLLQKADGQWFANMLGIREELLHHVRNANGKDIAEGLAMNHALWPATMGYYIKQMLHPQTGLVEHEQAKAFFNEFVIGRGKIPAFRVDNQPYGVIVSSAFSRWSYGHGNETAGFYKALYTNLLKPLDTVWQDTADEYVKGADMNAPPEEPAPHFMDMLSLHASSVEFYQRMAMGDHSMWNISRFLNLNGQEEPGEGGLGDGLDKNTTADKFTTAFFTPYLKTPPKVFQLSFLTEETELKGPVIDNFTPYPYSETRGVEPIPNTSANYMEWLFNLSTSITDIKDEIFESIGGEPDQEPPRALLYLMLRHALLTQYMNTAMEMLIERGIITAEALFETEFKNIENNEEESIEENELIRKSVTEKLTQQTKAQSITEIEAEQPEASRRDKRTLKAERYTELSAELPEQIETEIQAKKDAKRTKTNKWDYVTKVYEELTGELDMGAYLKMLLEGNHPDVADIQELRMALEILHNLPTARLERIFAEHLDTCNYRLDAWFSGLALQRLEAQQAAQAGVYLGAYGILENIEENLDFIGIHAQDVANNGEYIIPDPAMGLSEFHPISPDGQPVPYTFTRNPETGIPKVDPVENPNSQGFIHTPSLTHATTAAILRSGYLAGKNSQAGPDAMSINLSSKRVREAFFYLDGIQKGQSLAEMLGYRFERELNEQEQAFNAGQTVEEVLEFLRIKFPLVAGSVTPLNPVNVQNQQARNVVHGSKLIEAYKNNSTNLGPEILPGYHSLILNTIYNIDRGMDALSDVLTAESVYQLARGNAERSGAIMKALSEGGFIQEPEIIKTPRLSNSFTQRMGISFDPVRSRHDHWSTEGTPRSHAEPGLNGWLYGKLPRAEDLRINFTYFPPSGIDHPGTCSISDLKIEPIDLIYLVQLEGTEDALNELSSRIAFHIKRDIAQQDDIQIEINYMDRSGFVGAQLSMFEVLALLQELRLLVDNSRAMNLEDFLLPGEIDDEREADTSYKGLKFDALETRLNEVIGLKPGYNDSLSELRGRIDTNKRLVEDTDPTKLPDLRRDLAIAAEYGIPNGVPKTAISEETEDIDRVLDLSEKMLDLLQKKYDEADAILAEIPVFPAPGPKMSELKEVTKQLEDAAKAVFGESFKVYRDFGFHNANDIRNGQTNSQFFASAGELAPQRWLQGASKVRERLTNYQRVKLYSDALKNKRSLDLTVVQLPVISTTDDRWIAMQLPVSTDPSDPAYEIPGDSVSVVLETPNFLRATALHAGMMVDEWIETIPDPEVQSGVAMHYNSPNSEAPNALIMAVSPNETGRWNWEDLMDTVDETLSMAKKRAVEPDHLKDKIWGQVVPALIGPIDPADTQPSLDFRRNNEPEGEE